MPPGGGHWNLFGLVPYQVEVSTLPLLSFEPSFFMFLIIFCHNHQDLGIRNDPIFNDLLNFMIFFLLVDSFWV